MNEKTPVQEEELKAMDVIGAGQGRERDQVQHALVRTQDGK